MFPWDGPTSPTIVPETAFVAPRELYAGRVGLPDLYMYNIINTILIFSTFQSLLIIISTILLYTELHAFEITAVFFNAIN